MKAFEYAAPRHESELVALLRDAPGHAVVMAGGTDLMGLMKKMIVAPDRVVNIKEVASLRGISGDSQGVTIGATTTLEDVLESPHLEDYPAVLDAIRGINSLQLQAQGTIGGELCQRPRCWYYRDGHGLLASSGRMVTEGDNRFHAILGNAGPAKFVCPSRLAPALLVHGAQVRIAGPGDEDESLLPLETFFRTPKNEREREHTLGPAQVLTHIHLPAAADWSSATYEVRHGEGPDYPLAAAAAALRIEDGIVREARLVLGQVAPTPWIAHEAAAMLVGQRVDGQSAAAVAKAAVAAASPLSGNAYKVQLAEVSAKRALLLAAGLPSGGF